MLKDFKLWFVLLVISLSCAVVFENFSDFLVRFLYSILSFFTIVLAIHIGTKGCDLVGCKRCFTLLFKTCVVFLMFMFIALIIGGACALYWFWRNNWPAFEELGFSPFLIGFCIECCFIILVTMVYPLIDTTKMCPYWSDEDEEKRD